MSILNIQHLFNQIIIFLRNLSKYFNHKNFKSLQIQNIHLLFTIIYIFTLHYFLSKITLIIFSYQIFQKFFFIIIQSFVKYRITFTIDQTIFSKHFRFIYAKEFCQKRIMDIHDRSSIIRIGFIRGTSNFDDSGIWWLMRTC